MFRKLLKYDLRAVFKYWWIAAVSSVGLSVFGGVCLNIVEVDYTAYQGVYALGTLGFFLSLIGIGILPAMAITLVLVRLYKHFFTDEGYLTFTLPVKKSQLLNSKLLMAFLVNVVTILFLIVDLVVLLAVGVPEEIFNIYRWRNFFRGLQQIFSELGGGFLCTIILECVVLAVLLLLFGILAMFVCLTVASSITKKHRILTAIGLYYGGSCVISGAIQIVTLNQGFYTMFDRMAELSMTAQKTGAVVMLLALIGLAAVLCAALYLAENALLYKHLNLE